MGGVMVGFMEMETEMATYPHLTSGPKATARGVGSTASMMGVDTVTCTKVLRWVRLIPTLLGIEDLPLENKAYPAHGMGNGMGWHGHGQVNGQGTGYGPVPWYTWGDGLYYGGGNGRGIGYGYGNEAGDCIHY